MPGLNHLRRALRPGAVVAIDCIEPIISIASRPKTARGLATVNSLHNDCNRTMNRAAPPSRTWHTCRNGLAFLPRRVARHRGASRGYAARTRPPPKALPPRLPPPAVSGMPAGAHAWHGCRGLNGTNLEAPVPSAPSGHIDPKTGGDKVMMRRRDFLVSAAATCLGPGLAGAQGAWPQKPISLVVRSAQVARPIWLRACSRNTSRPNTAYPL